MNSGRFWIFGRDIKRAPGLLEGLASCCTEFSAAPDGACDAMLVTATSEKFPVGEDGQPLRLVMSATLFDDRIAVEIQSAETTGTSCMSHVSVRDYREERRVAEARMKAIATDHLTHRPMPLSQDADGVYVPLEH
jgi:hypothetical protein